MNGSIIVALYSGPTTDSDGVLVRSSFEDDDITDVGCGTNLAELTQSMLAGDVYVNVHTQVTPSGEIRGQVK